MTASRVRRVAASQRAYTWAVAGAVLLALPVRAGAQTPPPAEEDLCVGCHLTLEEDRLSAPARDYPRDVHATEGFGCLSCHGSNGEPSAGAGFLARPDRRAIPTLCGRCHSDARFMRDYNPSIRVDQVQEYYTSVHGQRLTETDDPNVATCVSCHPAHAIRPPSDPESTVNPAKVAELCGSCHDDERLMATYDLPTDQLEDYRSSVHGVLLYEEGDLSAPTCNDCHGNHGAAPPGVSSIQNVCGECHVVMSDFFQDSRHVDVFRRRDLPGCEVCHGNHAILTPTDEDLGERSRSVCEECHAPGEPYGREFLRMQSLLDSLKREAERSRELLHEAENLGMEVSRAIFELEDVNNALTLARSAIHSFRIEPVQAEVERGLGITSSAAGRAETAFDEHLFRRIGLAVSASLILIIVLVIIARIRGIEAKVEEWTHAVSAFFKEAMSENTRVAACAILLELAYADEDFSTEERQHLESLIRERFELDEDEATRLVLLAEGTRSLGMDIGQFTRVLNEQYSRSQLMDLVASMWTLVMSDGRLMQREERLINRVTDLLGLEPAAVEEIRERVTTGQAEVK